MHYTMKGNTNMLKNFGGYTVLKLDNIKHHDHYDYGDAYIAIDCLDKDIQLQIYTKHSEQIASLLNETTHNYVRVTPFTRQHDGEQVDPAETKPRKLYLASSTP